MSVSTGKVLANMLDEQRNLTRFYLSKLKGEDMHRQFEVNGFTTNSPYWIIAHLCWAENSVGLKSLGHAGVDIPWLDDFRIGSSKEAKRDHQPSLQEVLATFKQIHAVTLEYLSEMTEEELDKDNETGISFGDNTSKRFMAMHTVRHEGTHCGQLSLIAKMYGKKTV